MSACTHTDDDKCFAFPFFKSLGVKISNVIFRKHVKRKGQTTSGLESICPHLESILGHVTCFGQWTSANMMKAKFESAHWILPSLAVFRS